jgi:hypothetical protein
MTQTQYSLKRGLKIFKEKGEAIVSRELDKLRTKDTFTPTTDNNLNDKQKKSALESLKFLKEK